MESPGGFATVLFEAPRISSYQYASDHVSHITEGKGPPEIFRWIDHYLAEGIDSVAHGYIAIKRGSYFENQVITLLISEVFERDVPAGFVSGLFSRLRDVEASGISGLSWSPVYDLGQVDLVGDPPELKGIRLPYLLASRLEALRDRREAVSVSSLIDELREGGYEVGPERQSELEDILFRLYVAGYLVRASGDLLDDPGGIQAQRRAAVRLWWSR